MSRLADEAAYFGAVADGVESQQEEIAALRQQLAEAQAEALEQARIVGMGAEREIDLRQQLAAFHSAVEHVTEDGCLRRSFVAMPEGWAMVHKDRLHDLELAEEQLAEHEKQAVLLQDSLREQITLLRGVFQLYIEEHEEFTDENNWTAMACSLEAHHIAKEAFHQPDVQAHSAGNLVELAIVVIKQLNLTAYADDLRQYTLCEKEPVVWMQSDHLSRFVHHACGAQATLVRCSDHQLMPDFKPLYAPKD